MDFLYGVIPAIANVCVCLRVRVYVCVSACVIVPSRCVACMVLSV